MGADAGTLTRLRAVDGPAGSAAWRSWLDGVIRAEIERLRVRYQLSLDEFRGLYVSDEQVDRLAAARDADRTFVAPDSPDPGEEPRLGRVSAQFGLSRTEAAVLFVAVAPELDRRYETLFAYLNDDVTRRHATVDLCLRLSGAVPGQMDPAAPLFAEGLLEGARTGPAGAWRSATVVPREPVRRFLLGTNTDSVPQPDVPLRRGLEPIVASLGSSRLTTVVLTGGPGDERPAAARAIAGALRRGLVEVSVEDGVDRVRDALLTARLGSACIYVGLDSEGGQSDPMVASVVRTALHSPVPTLFGVPTGASWHGLFESTDHEVVTLAPPAVPERMHLWRRALRERGVVAEESDLDAVAGLFSLYPGQIRRAAAAAARLSAVGDADLVTLASGARRQCTTSLEKLAERVALVHTWSDLVLPPPTLRRLWEFANAIRQRDTVFREWGFLRPAGGTASLRALFSGASGTGKTMSAAVVARDLGVDLFRIDLSAVVSKYIGETEKNLERIFTAAEGSNAILLFDEADALFGKRSEVRDAHDRYANIEVAYLLQRMETYDGVMILATNLARNLDEAFSRRIHIDIEFPLPDEKQRELLWRLLIPEAAPTRDDVDHAFLARQFQLTGGEIRNIALAAAILAAHEGAEIGMQHLVRAIARQRRKQGKIPTSSEFKHHLAVIREDGE